ncbi:MAG: DUF385 domain-containing protein [Myxococcales bacterium]|jgi:hypothetical protein|nr:MAG: DUF385 domain-containing protein [Myxococcales bacterium]
MDLDRFFTRINPLVVSILHAPGLHWILSTGLLTITVTGRRSGRAYTIPVGYQSCGDDLVVLVSKARRKNWWRNYEEPRALELHLHGRSRSGVAHLVASDSKEFGRHAERTFRRLPGIARQFGIRFDRRRGLTPDQLEQLRREGAIVRIALAPAVAGQR